jgi:hypothetical protein
VDVKRRGAGIAETMLASRRHDQRLAGEDSHSLLIQPHFGFAFPHGQHLLDRMRMGRSTDPWRDPLFEDA